MTQSEGFETWFQELPFVERPAHNIWFAKEAWLAACQFQRERNAAMVEHHVNGPGPLRAQLAAAIRGQQGE